MSITAGTYGTFQATQDPAMGVKESELFYTSLDGIRIESSTVREIALYSQITHANIACAYKIQISNARVQIWLERGMMTLDEWVRNAGFYKRKKYFSRIFGQLACALAYIHKLKIRHGDIKPANIIIMPDMSVKFIDFGSACAAIDSCYTRCLTTYGFVSPEDAISNCYGPSNDIWALGMCMVFYFTEKYLALDSLEQATAWHMENETVTVSRGVFPFAQRVMKCVLARPAEDRISAEALTVMLNHPIVDGTYVEKPILPCDSISDVLTQAIASPTTGDVLISRDVDDAQCNAIIQRLYLVYLD